MYSKHTRVLFVLIACYRDILFPPVCTSCAFHVHTMTFVCETCTICTEDFVETPHVPTVRLHCRHEFHYRCAKKWQRMQTWCPNCRQQSPILQNPLKRVPDKDKHGISIPAGIDLSEQWQATLTRLHEVFYVVFLLSVLLPVPSFFIGRQVIYIIKDATGIPYCKAPHPFLLEFDCTDNDTASVSLPRPSPPHSTITSNVISHASQGFIYAGMPNVISHASQGFIGAGMPNVIAHASQSFIGAGTPNYIARIDGDSDKIRWLE